MAVVLKFLMVAGSSLGVKFGRACSISDPSAFAIASSVLSVSLWNPLKKLVADWYHGSEDDVVRD